jgi:oxygen-independent coproporphyrinogen-3 oxidase
LAGLGEIVRECAGGVPAEWTVEMAPSSVTAERLAALRECGVNRISMGAQSFQPEKLEALGRRHSVAQVLKAYDRIRAAGFGNVNIDLMFALPGQSEADWVDDLRRAVALEPEHLSTYCLTFEEDTVMWLKAARGGARPDAEREARFHEIAWEVMAECGYAQYEVSNYARPGRACVHNLNTWRMAEWIGMGPSAASQFGGWRGDNVADLDRWLAGLEGGERMTEHRVALSAAQLAEDALIFGLRMNEGVDLAAAGERWPGAHWAGFGALLERLTQEELAVRQGDWIRLTPRGRLLADAVGAELIGVSSSA